MYYLIKNCNILRIVDECEEETYKQIVYNNYCIENDIMYVNKVTDIDDHYDGKPCKYSYCIGHNKYVVVHCENIKDFVIFPSYINKSILYYLEFVYYKKPELCHECDKLITVDFKRRL